MNSIGSNFRKYRLISKKGEGTFSEVLKAQCVKNGKYVAIKCMKNHFDSIDQVNNLREIQALRRLSPHPNIIKLIEVLYDQPTGRLALVFELMDMNIYELIRGRRHYIPEHRIKTYMYQLVKSMDHMHRHGIFHRDIKPENILIVDEQLKLADFGSCRGIYSKQPYTEYISTRWYRAPECLLTDGYYSYKMDMWGVGCVFFEIIALFPLFPGTNELDQIHKVHNILGTPVPEILAKMKRHSSHMDFNFPKKEGTGIAKLVPHASPECIELILKLLSYNPDERLSARQGLRHQYFRDIREAEKKQSHAQSNVSPSPSLADNTKKPGVGGDDDKPGDTERSGVSIKSKNASNNALPTINRKHDQHGHQKENDASAREIKQNNYSSNEAGDPNGGDDGNALPPIKGHQNSKNFDMPSLKIGAMSLSKPGYNQSMGTKKKDKDKLRKHEKDGMGMSFGNKVGQFDNMGKTVNMQNSDHSSFQSNYGVGKKGSQISTISNVSGINNVNKKAYSSIYRGGLRRRKLG